MLSLAVLGTPLVSQLQLKASRVDLGPTINHGHCTTQSLASKLAKPSHQGYSYS